jgi:sigma-B regulation protein RsbU (phosphoserine phosphatase)
VVTDYIALDSLQRIQDDFVSSLGIPIRVCTPDGVPATRESPLPMDTPPPADGAQAGPTQSADVPIRLEGEFLGRVVVLPAGITAAGPVGPESPAAQASPRTIRLLQLAASLIARRWNRERILRTRIAELAAMYRLTAEFTGKRDLQSVLDLVARTVVDLLGAKACSIRLLSEDGTELVIKAVATLSPEYLNKGPILLSDSKIDQQVVKEGKTVYVADERSDPRVLYSEEAAREGIVSALCAPLAYKGRCEGVIRVYMAEVHEFDWYERSLLQAIAAQAAAAIVNARLYEEAVSGAHLRKHVQMAAEVQRRMIPASAPKLPGIDIAAVYEPCFELGGDFYDFHEFAADNLGLAVCDVVGKGVRASLLMASIRASLRAHAADIFAMSEVLKRVNRDLCADTAMSDFATLFYGVIDARNRRLTYANAGHSPPLLVRAGKSSQLTTGGGVLGINPDFAWRHETMSLQAGDVLLIYTDGLTDATNFRDEFFGSERVEQVARTAIEQGMAAGAIARHVLWELRRFTGLQTRPDDLTLIVIKVS